MSKHLVCRVGSRGNGREQIAARRSDQRKEKRGEEARGEIRRGEREERSSEEGEERREEVAAKRQHRHWLQPPSAQDGQASVRPPADRSAPQYRESMASTPKTAHDVLVE